MIERQFRQYMAKVYPQGVPPQQEAEIRQAFFAGASEVLLEVSAAADAGLGKGVRMLKELDRELIAYVAHRAAELKNPSRQ